MRKWPLNVLNVCVIMIDATEGFITEQDSKVAGLAPDEAGKGCVIVVKQMGCHRKRR